MATAGSSTLALILQDKEMVFPAVVSVLHVYQLTRIARAVGDLRRKHKINPPAISGDPEFERGLRAQQNTVEFVPVFLVLLWVSAKYFNPVLASVTSLLYIKARKDYFAGYLVKPGGRLAGFLLCVRILMLLFAYSIAGLVHTALQTFFSINVLEITGLSGYIPFAN